MPGFNREREAVRSSLITFRATAEEKELLEAMVKPLGVRGTSDVIRQALDCFLASARGKAIVARLKR